MGAARLPAAGCGAGGIITPEPPKSRWVPARCRMVHDRKHAVARNANGSLILAPLMAPT